MVYYSVIVLPTLVTVREIRERGRGVSITENSRKVQTPAEFVCPGYRQPKSLPKSAYSLIKTFACRSEGLSPWSDKQYKSADVWKCFNSKVDMR